MTPSIFTFKSHLCTCPNYRHALMKQSNKSPTYKRKTLVFGEEMRFKIKGHDPIFFSTCKNWLPQLDRFLKQNMLPRLADVVSSLPAVYCNLTGPFRWLLSFPSCRRCTTGGVALLLLLLKFVSEASSNNLTSPPHASYDCQDVSYYYSSLEGLKGGQLMEKMHNIVSLHHSIPYNQVWDALGVLDAADIEHPKDSPNVIEIYSQKVVPKVLAGKLEGWNREHLWPRSYGLITGPELTDLHNLHPADVNVNSSRGNKYYGECVTSGTDCLSPANPEAAPDTATDKESWTPPAKVRGDIARSMMYMAICYGFNQPLGSYNLQLSDSPSMENAQMGRLSVLMRWHEVDPPSRSEQLRNNTICKIYQHNRNPFVDHPEYATLIWFHSGVEAPVPITSGINGNAFLHERERNVWVNKLHYENKGNDKNEVISSVFDY